MKVSRNDRLSKTILLAAFCVSVFSSMSARCHEPVPVADPKKPQSAEPGPNDPAVQAWARKKSEIAFHQIFSNLNPDPKSRNYTDLVRKVDDLLHAFPGSDASYRSLFAVRKWSEAGLVPPARVAELQAFVDGFNPARSKLEQLEKLAADAVIKHDVDTLRTILGELNSIVTTHPGTVSAFIAAANRGPLQNDIGDYKGAANAVEYFFKTYAYEETDFPQSDSYFHANLFLRAKLSAQTDSIESGVKRYSEIASVFQGRPGFALLALFSGGELALKHKKPDLSVPLFEEIISDYSAVDDKRVQLATFRLAEAYFAMGDKERAKQLLTTFKATQRDSYWLSSADEMLAFIESGGLRSQRQPEMNAPTVDDQPKSPRTSGSVILVAGNIALITIVGIVMWIRSRRPPRNDAAASGQARNL